MFPIKWLPEHAVRRREHEAVTTGDVAGDGALVPYCTGGPPILQAVAFGQNVDDSGEPRGVGPKVAQALERAFPGWATPVPGTVLHAPRPYGAPRP